MAKHSEDVALVQRAMRRELGAQRELAARIACVPAFLRRRAARIGVALSAAVLDDLSQDTYLAVLRKLETYRGESAIESWACGFAFVSLQRWRDENRRRTFKGALVEVESLPQQPSPAEGSPEIEQVLERLPPPAGTVIRLKHFDDLTFTDIARRLDLSANTVKAHYYRGLERLRQWLGARGKELIG